MKELFLLYQDQCDTFAQIKYFRIENVESIADSYETDVSNIYIPPLALKKLKKIIRDEGLHMYYVRVLEDGLKNKKEDDLTLCFSVLQNKYKIICTKFWNKKDYGMPKYKWYLRDVIKIEDYGNCRVSI